MTNIKQPDLEQLLNDLEDAAQLLDIAVELHLHVTLSRQTTHMSQYRAAALPGRLRYVIGLIQKEHNNAS